MAVSEDNVRIMTTIPKEIDEYISKVAEEENRSKSNLVATIIKNWYNSNKES